MNKWIELRDTDGRLYGRLDLCSLRLETKRAGRLIHFDLLASVRERRPVVVRLDTHLHHDKLGD
ncbi:MAG: hypothetical protein R3C14_28800 [Caldilineaceae bacterium]